jgi:hypothetical protein
MTRDPDMALRSILNYKITQMVLISFLCVTLTSCSSTEDVAPEMDTVGTSDTGSVASDMPLPEEDSGSTSTACPVEREAECEEKTIWALDGDNGQCCEYSGFCKSPEDWESYKDLETCKSAIGAPSETCPPPLDIPCEEKTFWAKNPNSGECCEYARPCTTPSGWEKFKDIETCEEPTTLGTGCPPAVEAECEEKAVWALDKPNNICCEYAGFCMVPEGLETYKEPGTCEGELESIDAADCPPPAAAECEEKAIWAKNNSTGTCCEYNGFCLAPDSWETYKDPQTCEADTD